MFQGLYKVSFFQIAMKLNYQILETIPRYNIPILLFNRKANGY